RGCQLRGKRDGLERTNEHHGGESEPPDLQAEGRALFRRTSHPRGSIPHTPPSTPDDHVCSRSGREFQKESIQYKTKENDWREEISVLNPKSLICGTPGQHF